MNQIEHFIELLRNIPEYSKNNPLNPEFPSHKPVFPASQTYRLHIEGFTNVWIKDESTNPTGTHKDRLAWEIIVTYRDIIRSRIKSHNTNPLPQFSIISSGSAAVAIQTALNQYNLPSLKVLIDYTTEQHIVNSLTKLGCEIYTVDLGIKCFNSEEILTLTHNTNGYDITSLDALDPSTRFYDWLSYEIVNESPEYCFIPYGSGHLYENIINIAKIESQNDVPDPRYSGNIETLQQCHFLGATTKNKSTKAVKLYSPHLPFAHVDTNWLKIYKEAGYCGALSGIHSVEELSLEKAMNIVISQGIQAEYSAVASLALLLEKQTEIPKDVKILIVSTGKCVMA